MHAYSLTQLSILLKLKSAIVTIPVREGQTVFSETTIKKWINTPVYILGI